MNKGFLRKSVGKMNRYKEEQWLFRKIPSTKLILCFFLKEKFVAVFVEYSLLLQNH